MAQLTQPIQSTQESPLPLLPLLDINQLNHNHTGRGHSNPLGYAFTQKLGAHAHSQTEIVPPSQQEKQLQQLLAQSQPSRHSRCLYIHIPFCRARCTYCNFFQYASSRRLIDRYFQALCVEIQHRAAEPWSQAAPFHTVYIGGGTPTDLTPAQIRQLGQMICQFFPLTTDCELTLEGRVHRFDQSYFDAALEGGFNRFSFGVQSFDSQVRRRAKRFDDRDTVLNRIEMLASQDAAPIVIDLLYGLPHQSRQVWEQDLADYLSCGAHGVDLYQLGVAGDAPMIRMVAQGKLPAPASTPEKSEMFAMGVAWMTKHHQRRLSVNHWARDNRERSLYNSLAKTTAEVLPLGAGAGGNIGGYGLMQIRQLDDYIAAIEAGRPALAMMTKSGPLAPLFATIKAQLDRGVMCRHPYIEQYQFDLFAHAAPLFEAWQTNGLASLEGDDLNLTLAGQFWSVSMAQGLIDALQQQTTSSTREH